MPYNPAVLDRSGEIKAEGFNAGFGALMSGVTGAITEGRREKAKVDYMSAALEQMQKRGEVDEDFLNDFYAANLSKKEGMFTDLQARYAEQQKVLADEREQRQREAMARLTSALAEERSVAADERNRAFYETQRGDKLRDEARQAEQGSRLIPFKMEDGRTIYMTPRGAVAGTTMLPPTKPESDALNLKSVNIGGFEVLAEVDDQGNIVKTKSTRSARKTTQQTPDPGQGTGTRSIFQQALERARGNN